MSTSVSKQNELVRRLESDRLSHFRTRHTFLHYAEFSTVEQFEFCKAYAEKLKLPVLVLGNGSNVLFSKPKVTSVVLKNRLPSYLTAIDSQTVVASSSVLLAQLLKYCHDNGLDSCYYLASVPATVGGAIAMNAGRGRQHGQSIFDFVESVTIWRNGAKEILQKADIPIDYRQTPFTGLSKALVLEVRFRFPLKTDDTDLRQQRIKFSKETQDHSAPNCGSVFKLYDIAILKRMKGVRLFTAQYSKKTLNWILSSGPSSRPIVWLVGLTKLLHFLLRRRCVLEIIEVR